MKPVLNCIGRTAGAEESGWRSVNSLSARTKPGTENQRVVARDWGWGEDWGMENCCFMGTELLFYKMKRVPEMVAQNERVLKATELNA